MNRSARRQHHDQARKKHKHEQEQHARELAKRGQSKFPVWLLVGTIGALLALVILSFLAF